MCYTEPMKHLTYDEFKAAAAAISEQTAFELLLRTAPDGTAEGYVPHIMNDGMECYMVLEHCRVVGTILEDYTGQTQVQFADHTMGISVRQGDNVYTAWFTGVRRHQQLYRYHDIGHFWTPGQEQWRRLVYMVGTIYDKIKYAPERAFTEAEAELSCLMEFVPFRIWSPVSESILPLYPDSPEGALTFAKFAEEAGDWKLAKQCRAFAERPGPLKALRLSNRLNKAKSMPVYDLIFRKVCAASAVYPARDYGAQRNARIAAERERVTQALYDEGFTGAYPLFRRPGMEVLAAEEHPFTVLESEDYKFRIRFMVSQYPESDEPNGICPGFFDKRGYKSYIWEDAESHKPTTPHCD